MNQYEQLVPVGLRESRRDGLCNVCRYGYFVDSVDVMFVCSLFIGYFYSFKNRGSFTYVILNLCFFLHIDSDRLINV